jgi:hypothetical protein
MTSRASLPLQLTAVTPSTQYPANVVPTANQRHFRMLRQAGYRQYSGTMVEIGRGKRGKDGDKEGIRKGKGDILKMSPFP